MLVCRHSQVKHKNKRQGSEHLLKLVYSLPVGGHCEVGTRYARFESLPVTLGLRLSHTARQRETLFLLSTLLYLFLYNKHII